jgi:hypothetical protein
LITQDVRMRFLSVLPSLVAFPFLVLAEGPVKLDCTIHSWNEHFKKEKDHDSQHGYSTTKIAPKDIEWLHPGASAVGRMGQVGPTHGLVVLGYCRKGNITNTAELRNILIKLSKLVSDHGGNAISYDKSGTEMRFYFLRLEDKIYAAAKRGNEGPNASKAPVVLPTSR